MATLPCPQIPRPMAVVAQAITLEGVLMSTPTTPAAGIAAVPHVGGVSHVHAAAYKSQCASIFLDRGIERHAVIVSGRIYFDGPAGIDCTRVHVQREYEMFFRSSTVCCGEGINKERAGRYIDDGSTRDPYRIDVATPESVQWELVYRCFAAKLPFP
jgi:hypothetical protein